MISTLELVLLDDRPIELEISHGGPINSIKTYVIYHELLKDLRD